MKKHTLSVVLALLASLDYAFAGNAVISGNIFGSVMEAGGMNNSNPGIPTATGTLTDTDPDNPPNTFQAIPSAPSLYGSWSMSASGTWNYTLNNTNATVQALNNGQMLFDSFFVATVDGTTQTITIGINGANDAAVISGTTVGTVTEAGGVNNSIVGTPTATGTLTDTDVDNTPNTFIAFTTATTSVRGYGTYTLTASGTWTYTLDNNNPAVQALNTGQMLFDLFLFNTIDGTPGAVQITINGVNDAAVISGTTTGTVTEAGGVNNAITGTPTATGTLTDTDVDNTANTFISVSTATASSGGFGSYTMAASGTWNYTLNNNNAAVQGLNVGQTLTDTFTVTTIDGTAQVVTITIHGVNDAAVISGTTSGAVVESGGVNNSILGTPTATGTLTDTDVDNTANTFNAVTTATASTGGYGTFTITASGVWTYTLNNNNPAVQALNTGQTLTDHFTVTTIDGTQQVVTITINGVNDSAVISGTTTGAVVEAGGINNAIPGTPTATGMLTDTDVDNSANTFTAVTTAGGYGTFTISASGTWNYTLNNNNASVQALNVGQTLTDTITVTTVDGTPQLVTITINGANDAAVISGTTSGSVTEAGGVNNSAPGTLTAIGILTDTDLDNLANSFTAVGASTASTSGYGTYTMIASGVWTYTLDNNNPAVQALNVGQTLTDHFTVNTVDGTAQIITITIHGANDAAVISGTSSGTVLEAGGVNNAIPGTPVTTGTLNDTDVDNPPNNFTAVTTATASAGGYGTYTMAASGTWTYALNNNNPSVQALNAGQTLTDHFTITTIDGTAQVVTITINGANDSALISGNTTGIVVEAGGVNNSIAGTPIASGFLSDTDVDNPPNTFTAVTTATASAGGYGTYTMTAVGGWVYTLDNNNSSVQALNTGQTLPDHFTVTTIDGTPQIVTITINGANDAAVISGTSLGTVVEAGGVNNGLIGTPVATGTLTNTDVDNPSDSFTAVTTASASAGGYGSYTMTASGTWTYTLNNNNASVQALNIGQVLNDVFTVTTVDGTPVLVVIFIDGANDAAVISGTTTGTVTEASGVNNTTAGTPTATGTLTDTDVDNPPNTFIAVPTATTSTAGYGTFTMTASGTWTYTLNNSNAAVQALNVGQTLFDFFTFSTVDGTPQFVSITINGANDAAVISGTSSGSVVEPGGVYNNSPGAPTATGTLADTDVDNPPNTFTAVSTAATSTGGYGTYTMTTPGVWTYSLSTNNATVQALRVGQTLADTFAVSTVDGTPEIVDITISSLRSPMLAITYTGNATVVSWPAAVTGWTLQTNATLAGNTWSNYLGPIINNTVTNSPPIGNLFFRLTQ